MTLRFRLGWGFDVHRLGGGGPLILCGVVVDEDIGLIATSDGDVAAHAVADALLGAAALGDLGTHFPASEPEWEGVSSMRLLRQVVTLCRAAGLSAGNVDVTLVAETVLIAAHRGDMRTKLASLLDIAIDDVSVKATTTDGLGFLGRGEGIAAFAVATLQPAS